MYKRQSVVASGITIGFGGSVGAEAPIVLTGCLLYTSDIIVFDHFNNTMELIALQESEDPHSSLPELDELLKAVNKANVKPYDFHPVGETTSTLTDEEHKANIRRCIQHCLRGDVFQIVVSRRFVQKYEGDDFKLYRALRSINPSPYLFYFDFGGFRIFGSSPETHNRIVGNKAFIDPIAGTCLLYTSSCRGMRSAGRPCRSGGSHRNLLYVLRIDNKQNKIYGLSLIHICRDYPRIAARNAG